MKSPIMEEPILNSHNKEEYPPMHTAEHILKGLRRKRRIITFDWKFRLVVGLWHLIPRGLWERMTFIKTQ